MIVIMSGPLGAGKTVNMVKWAYTYSLKAGGVPVWGNMTVIPGAWNAHRRRNPAFKLGELKKADDIIEMTRQGGGILLLDEMYRLLDARLSMAYKNVFLSEMCMYLRKIGVTVFASSQTERMMDLRIRDIIEIYVKCLKYRGPEGYIFEYRTYDYQRRQLLKTEEFTEAQTNPFFAMFDSWEFVKGFDFPNTQRKFDDFMDRLEKAAKEARKNERGTREAAISQTDGEQGGISQVCEELPSGAAAG